MARLAGVLVVTVAFGAGAPIVSAHASTNDATVVINGVGAAHGFGMAMDGVEGQARAGWTHDRILSLFYPGTMNGRATGTIRVGLAEASTTTLSLPNGGFVSDAPRGSDGTGAFPMSLPPNARVSLALTAGGVSVSVAGITAKPQPTTKPESAQREPEEPGPPSGLLPTPPPAPVIEPSPTPGPRQEPPASKKAPSGAASRIARAVWLWGNGDPAIVHVSATGHAYRGVIVATPRAGALSVVNHVDLETYVAGIAEEKGAGWPLAGLKTLAVAARTLGAATLTWYDKNQANGYDICPTESCQVYLGYDGEEPLMRQATAETAGVIRTYNGRPILAMYHGNGGGQTESYKRVIDNGTDPHPYLASVKYPYADPSHWTVKTTTTEIEHKLRAAGVAIPGALQRVDITERGISPRVLALKLVGADGEADVSGVTFAGALDLRSTWFDIGSKRRTNAVATGTIVPPVLGSSGWTSDPSAPDSWWAAPLTTILALSALASAVAWAASPDASLVGAWLLSLRRARLRLRHATS